MGTEEPPATYSFELVSITDATTVFIAVNKFFDWQAKFNFVNARFVDMTTGRNKLCTGTCSNTYWRHKPRLRY